MITKFEAGSEKPGYCWYAQVAPDDVDPRIVRILERVLSLVALNLGIESSSLEVKWATYESADVAIKSRGAMLHTPDDEPFTKSLVALLPCTFGGLVPFHSTNVIVLNAAPPSSFHFVRAAIEEVIHVHQNRNWTLEQLKDGEVCERDAGERAEEEMPKVLNCLELDGLL